MRVGGSTGGLIFSMQSRLRGVGFCCASLALLTSIPRKQGVIDTSLRTGTNAEFDMCTLICGVAAVRPEGPTAAPQDTVRATASTPGRAPVFMSGSTSQGGAAGEGRCAGHSRSYSPWPLRLALH